MENRDNADEALSLFRVDDLERCKHRMNSVHADARRHDPGASLPQLAFLDGDCSMAPEGKPSWRAKNERTHYVPRAKSVIMTCGA
ncbi:hypothetical protein [Lysobacter sp. CFH 32150]|uniref:hypothetical protein n=1 Tax=Lysobacter sp. CFH 32150 TaxID=2927128 RepID=UPI001FA6EEB1|nr:hypothetical protein [Lysobacter sp. CFH 32150]MCI4567386.1 hypothetical protein [Lysobacter sp. CFH 32150]